MRIENIETSTLMVKYYAIAAEFHEAPYRGHSYLLVEAFPTCSDKTSFDKSRNLPQIFE